MHLLVNRCNVACVNLLRIAQTITPSRKFIYKNCMELFTYYIHMCNIQSEFHLLNKHSHVNIYEFIFVDMQHNSKSV